MKTLCVPCRSGRFISVAAAVVILAIPALSLADTDGDLKKWFADSAGKRDHEAGRRIMALKDEAVPFLVEELRKQEPHPVEYSDYQGHHKEMGTWSQEAADLLGAIDTPKVAEEARKLAEHENEFVRWWGVRILRGCDSEREQNVAFLRKRVEQETGRSRSDIVEFLAELNDPSDMPLFKKLAGLKDVDLHEHLALSYALARNGDQEAMLNIVKVCEKETGHFGWIFLTRLSGQEFDSMMKARLWIAGFTPEKFKKVMAQRVRSQEAGDDGWQPYLEAVTRLEETGDRAAAAVLFKDFAAKFPKSDYTEDARELANLLEKMAAEDREWKEPGDPKELTTQDLISSLVYHLRDIDCFQWAPPEQCDLLSACGRYRDRGNPAAGLLKVGEAAAVPALLGLLEDRRPIRATGYWHDEEERSRTVLRYQDVAFVLLNKLAKIPWYEKRTGAGYFSADEAEDRAAGIRVLRTWFEDGQGKSPGERKWLAYHAASLYPAGLAILQSLAKDEGKKEEVLTALRRLYQESHWAYRPLVVEIMVALGDASRVKEVLADREKYLGQIPEKPELVRVRIEGEDALSRLRIPEKEKEKPVKKGRAKRK